VCAPSAHARLDAAAHKGHPRTRGRGLVMAKDWRCLIGLHDWREVEMPDRDKCAECTRCGKRDWRRLLTRTAGQWRGGDPPPGSLRGVGTQTRVTPRCHGPISSTCLARSGNPAAHSYAAIRALDCRRSAGGRLSRITPSRRGASRLRRGPGGQVRSLACGEAAIIH